MDLKNIIFKATGLLVLAALYVAAIVYFTGSDRATQEVERTAMPELVQGSSPAKERPEAQISTPKSGQMTVSMMLQVEKGIRETFDLEARVEYELAEPKKEKVKEDHHSSLFGDEAPGNTLAISLGDVDLDGVDHKSFDRMIAAYVSQNYQIEEIEYIRVSFGHDSTYKGRSVRASSSSRFHLMELRNFEWQGLWQNPKSRR